MDFGHTREGYCEDDEQMMMMMSKGKHPFSNSSSSSSPTTCSSHQHMSLGPINSTWLGRSNSNTSTTDGENLEQQSDDYNSSNAALVQQQGSSTPAGPSSSSFATIEKEHMFDKVVTPSDVGKLNRLVIPKQYAEKYFPLDSSTNEKGMLLNFEDRDGKPWRFRYSYWNSSQSYVMTKGWSRFVKEKKLDAGDVVSFQRGVGELGKDRLYIDWRRRPDALPHNHQLSSLPNFGLPHNYPIHRSIPWSPLLLRPPGPAMVSAAALPGSQFHSVSNVNLYPYRNNYVGGGGSSSFYAPGNNVIYMRPAAMPPLQWQQHGGGSGGEAVEPMVFDSVPVVHGTAAASKRRLRLFGVNMDCSISDDQEENEYDALPSTAVQNVTTTASQDSQLSSLQLRLYSGTPMQTNFQDKGKGPSL